MRYNELQSGSRQNALADRLTASIWRRLQKTYPGIREMDSAEENEAYHNRSEQTEDKIRITPRHRGFIPDAVVLKI